MDGRGANQIVMNIIKIGRKGEYLAIDYANPDRCKTESRIEREAGVRRWRVGGAELGEGRGKVQLY